MSPGLSHFLPVRKGDTDLSKHLHHYGKLPPHKYALKELLLQQVRRQAETIDMSVLVPKYKVFLVIIFFSPATLDGGRESGEERYIFGREISPRNSSLGLNCTIIDHYFYSEVWSIHQGTFKIS